MNKSWRAFAWVDVLVVVAGIALLAAILIPILGKARLSVRRSTCLANMGGLNQSLQKYTVDWNSLLTYGVEVPAIQGNFWTNPLSRYSGDAEKMRQCPEALVANSKIFTAGSASVPWNQPDSTFTRPQTGAYTINGWLYKAHFASAIYLGEEAAFLEAENRHDDARPPATVIDPDSFYHLPVSRKADAIPTFADAIWSETFPATYDPAPADLGSGSGPELSYHLGQMCIARHGRAVNVAFFDGHAETVAVEKLWTLNWQAQWIAPDSAPVFQ